MPELLFLAGPAIAFAVWFLARVLVARAVGGASLINGVRLENELNARSTWRVRVAHALAGLIAVYVVIAVSAGLAHHLLGDRVPSDSSRVDVVLDGPAKRAGLRNGDRIVSIDGMPVARFDELRTIVSEHTGSDTLITTVDRDGAELKLEITIDDAGGRRRIGVLPHLEIREVGLFEGLGRGFTFLPDMIRDAWRSLTRSHEADLEAPVRMVDEMRDMGGPADERSPGLLLQLVAISMIRGFLGLLLLTPLLTRWRR